MTKRTTIVLLVLSALIALGFTKSFDPNYLGRLHDFSSWLIVVLSLLAPFMPLALIVVRILLPRPLASEQSTLVATLAFLGGLYVAYFAGQLPGPAAYLVPIQVSLLALAIASGILVLAFGRLERIGVWVAKAGFMLATLGALWSLAAIPIALIRADRLAKGAQHCLTYANSWNVIDSIWDLRGYAFYSTSGYLLLVLDPKNERIKLYRWSPGRLRFEPWTFDLDPHQLSYRLMHPNPQSCEPPSRF